MEYQLTHEDEKGYGEQRECGNGRKDPCHHRNQAWYTPQEEIGSYDIDNEKGEGNGQVGKKHEDHASKEQADDQPPFHGLPPCPDINQPAPCHPEELDGKEDAAYGNNDEYDPFWNRHPSYVGHSFCDAFTCIVNSKIDHKDTNKPADDKDDEVEITFCFLIEMSVDNIGSDMPFFSQKPGSGKEDDPQQGIFGRLHDPYRCLRK
jgi:hypothetical protein